MFIVERTAMNVKKRLHRISLKSIDSVRAWCYNDKQWIGGIDMIRLATHADVPAILAIYTPYILETAITFEYDVPTMEVFTARFDGIIRRYPWIVWEENGEILGYAYASDAFERAAFAWDADLSIYLRMDVRGKGIGSRLYDCLEQMLKKMGYHNLYALITGENMASVRFHERRGYECLGRLKQTGYKLNRWHDLYWYGLRLCPADAPDAVPKSFAGDEEDLQIMRKCSKE